MSLQDTKPADQLIAELIGTGQMSADTLSELSQFGQAFGAGTLDPDDLAYLMALHGRIMSTPGGEALPIDDVAEDLESALADALARAERAEAEVVRLTALLAGNQS